jgi:hypothetical protein
MTVASGFLQLEDAQAILRRKPTELSEEDRDYYLERRYPSGNLVPRDVASLQKKEVMLVLELIQEKQFI